MAVGYVLVKAMSLFDSCEIWRDESQNSLQPMQDSEQDWDIIRCCFNFGYFTNAMAMDPSSPILIGMRTPNPTQQTKFNTLKCTKLKHYF